MDLLTWFPEAGRYCLLQIRPPDANPATRPVLALIDVSGSAARIADPEAELKRQLVQAARRALPGERYRAVRDRVLADLANGLRLGAFVPHPTIEDSEITGHQTAELRTVGPERNGEFLIDGRKFDHNRIDRHLPLGGVEEWRISVPKDGQPHVFHIHVNPFQIVSIRNSSGEDRTDPASPGFHPFYAGLTGQWLDTILLEPETIVIMRTRYERFIGDIMLHCHLVAHSDLGMMQHIRIHLPQEPQVQHVHH